MKIFDLSLPMGKGMDVFPNTDPCDICWTTSVEKDQYKMGFVTLNTHAGTHCDAPAHFLADGAGMEHWRLERCVGQAHILDFSSKQPREEITARDLLQYEQYLTPGARILLRTDWDKQFGTGDRYFRDYPGIAVDAAKLLAEKKIGLVGVEAASMNDTHGTEVHRTLLGGDVMIVECLSHLRDIGSDTVFFAAAPLNFKDADGMPVRAFGILF
ncbi:MAG: cyclase family protein [Oscillospiraceae bacterium]|nr:cyclase family protein [Oscillospiraceae bacterium]